MPTSDPSFEVNRRAAVKAGLALVVGAAPFAPAPTADATALSRSNRETVPLPVRSNRMSTSEANDFDFLLGKWRVRHRKLKQRLVGDTEWWEFDGETNFWSILGGLGNIDDNILDQPGNPYRAVTLRLFNPTIRQWSIWWISDQTLAIEPPVHGHFSNGIGTFFGDDVLEGRPIKVRFIWTEITERSARWEQAFSSDNGASWETNWIMQFERTA
jgi:hypothetical protein